VRRNGHYIIPLFFLLLTLTPVLLLGGLQAFQFYLKQRMEASLESGALQTLSLPASEVHWYEEGREILVEGKMFDIKTYAISNGVFTAQGVFDEEETEVMNLLNGHWSEKQQSHTVVQLLLLSHCIILFTFFIFSFTVSVCNNKPLSFVTFLYTSPLLSIISPPPKAFRCF